MHDLLDIAVLTLIYFFIFFPRWRKKGNDLFLLNTLMYIYLALVLYFTLMPIITSLPFIMNHPYVPMNLTPFIDVTLSRGDYTEQIILNIIMTMPFGFLFPLIRERFTRRASLLSTILATFLLSLSIELIQPLLSTSRSSDITDIITNVTGGIIGYLIYLILRPLARKILNWVQSRSITN